MAFSSRVSASLVAFAAAFAVVNAEQHVVHFANKLRYRLSALFSY